MEMMLRLDVLCFVSEWELYLHNLPDSFQTSWINNRLKVFSRSGKKLKENPRNAFEPAFSCTINLLCLLILTVNTLIYPTSPLVEPIVGGMWFYQCFLYTCTATFPVEVRMLIFPPPPSFLYHCWLFPPAISARVKATEKSRDIKEQGVVLL